MKVPFKPLSLAAAVAAASFGTVGIVNAQSLQLAANEGLGDLAIVPYYTVNNSYSTGVDIINTSASTQVVKIRLRRAKDSMDALDFNVVMSPQDVWTGYIQKAPNSEEIRFYSNDKSCTVPAFSVTDPEVNYFVMPGIYRAGAESGYIEVIGMGATYNELQPIAVAAKHNNATGIPADCTRVRDNFFRGKTPSNYFVVPPANAAAAGRNRGVINSVTTWQYTSSANTTPVQSTYIDTDNVLKVSYFIKSDVTGNEFGGDAVHIANFMDGGSITNQSVGVNEGDLQGFDHPDLNGGAPWSVFSGVSGAADDSRYFELRPVLGAAQVINDWSAKKDGVITATTDWVVTAPGQYLMTNLPGFIGSLVPNSGYLCKGNGNPGANNYNPTTGINCDFRDIPMVLTASVYDREELGIAVEEDDLVISPQPPGVVTVNVLDQEVNVINWTDSSVLGAVKLTTVPVPEGANNGWASVSVTPNVQNRAICEYTALNTGGVKPTTTNLMPMTCTSVSDAVPLVGFAAWERAFADKPNANYGRIVDHSYASSP